VGELLDEETRSVPVFVLCDNAERKLKPGMFADIRFTGAPEKLAVIPSTAVLQSERGSYVFVRVGKDKYVKRNVETVNARRKEVAVNGGLQAGEVIVAGGAIYLANN
jgi:cobalt-zinc-cadmium efflux system membrane fusion protein